ncbi:MAG: hypothetical protein H2076_06530 [Planctomycetes bacterium]|nr:hypothetical protein [Planctomycetota bacterium]
MNRKSLWILLWVVVVGFGMSWVGIQKMILKRDVYKNGDHLKETRRLHEELLIEKIRLESALVRSMRQAEMGEALIPVGNSLNDPGVLAPRDLEER